MEKKRIYFIYMPSPMLGRNPLQGVNGAGIFGGLFGLNTEFNYIDALERRLKADFPSWVAYRDDTESDIEKLIEQQAIVLVCAPGLKYQFYLNGFNKKNVVYLSTYEYSTNNITPVIKRIKEIESEK